MKSPTPRRIATVAVSVSLLGVGLIAYRAGANTMPEYRVNASGLTYGSASSAPVAALEPDLIAATATNGTFGYVYKTDLENAEQPAANPKEAVEKMKRLEEDAAAEFLKVVGGRTGQTPSCDVAEAAEALRRAHPGRGRDLLVALGLDAGSRGEAESNAIVAAALRRADATTIRRIRVFKVDGRTVVGVFEVGGGPVFPVDATDYAPE